MALSASGWFLSSTGIGLDPVESTPMPTTFERSKSSLRSASASAPWTLSLRPNKIVARMLARQQAVFRIKQNALRARRVIDHPTAVFRSVRTADDKGAHRVGSEIDA